MPAGNPFRAKASRSRLGSIARTNGNQGGGDKKAGLPPTMLMTQQRNLAFRHRHPILLPMSLLIQTANPNVKQSRPVDGRPLNYIGMGGNY
jgi:hypothetical protein